jgi:hypothetical protein
MPVDHDLAEAELHCRSGPLWRTVVEGYPMSTEIAQQSIYEHHPISTEIILAKRRQSRTSQ